MWRFYLIDTIMFLAASSTFMLMPLRNEFIYQKVSEMHNHTKSGQTYCDNNTTNKTSQDQSLADDISRWTLYINLSIFLPAMLVGALLTSWSDKVGRKVTLMIPLTGMTTSSILQALIILLKWPLETMLAYGLIAGGTGYFMTVLIQGTTYLSDVTPLEKKGKRFTIMETFIGVGGGIAGLVGGYWIKAQGFLPSVWCTAALTLIGMILLPFLPDSLKIRAEMNPSLSGSSTPVINNNDEPPDYMEIDKQNESTPLIKKRRNVAKKQDKKSYNFFDLWKAVWRVYTTEYMTCDECFGPDPDIKSITSGICNHGGGMRPGRIWRLWLYVISYCAYMFTSVGILLFQTIFFLDYPLCFTPVLVGAQVALKFLSNGVGPVIVVVLQRCCKIGNQSIILISLLGYFAFPFLMIFAKEPWLVFVATSAMTVGSIAKPFMQAQVASLASKSEQGAAFALLSSSEVLSFLLAAIGYLTMYSATQHISHYFVWMFSAGVAIIPIVLMGIVWIADRRMENSRRRESEEIDKPYIDD